MSSDDRVTLPVEVEELAERENLGDCLWVDKGMRSMVRETWHCIYEGGVIRTPLRGRLLSPGALWWRWSEVVELRHSPRLRFTFIAERGTVSHQFQDTFKVKLRNGKQDDFLIAEAQDFTLAGDFFRNGVNTRLLDVNEAAKAARRHLLDQVAKAQGPETVLAMIRGEAGDFGAVTATAAGIRIAGHQIAWRDLRKPVTKISVPQGAELKAKPNQRRFAEARFSGIDAEGTPVKLALPLGEIANPETLWEICDTPQVSRLA